MLNTAKRLLASLAVAGLVMTPMAAQANTRAGDNASLYTSSQVQPGAARSAEGESLVGVNGAGDLIAWLLVALWGAGIIVIAADLDGDDEENQSPGAN